VKDFEKEIAESIKWGQSFGLSFFDTNFEYAKSDDMSMIASFGLPNRFTHWYFGGLYKSLKVKQDENLIKILELVLNTDPSYAFLLDTNSYLEHRMVIAHVFGHVDFFKNNRWYKRSNRDILNKCEQHARFIRKLTEEVGKELVDELIAAVLTISQSVNPFELDPEIANKRLIYFLCENVPVVERSIKKPGPLKTRLSTAKHLLSRIRLETDYFDLIGRTQIINEGWASFVESRILKEFLSPADWLNFSLLFGARPAPYQIGYSIFSHIFKQGGWEKCLKVRSLYEDITFVDEFLTEDQCRRLDLFVQNKETKEKEYDVKKVKNRIAYEKLYKGQPLLEVVDYNKKTRAITLLNSESDRTLDRKRAELFLKSLFNLWPFEININDGETVFTHNLNGFTHKRLTKK
jgi:stage V sporulation protein R